MDKFEAVFIKVCIKYPELNRGVGRKFVFTIRQLLIDDGLQVDGKTYKRYLTHTLSLLKLKGKNRTPYQALAKLYFETNEEILSQKQSKGV